jgi:hypothetical protein
VGQKYTRSGWEVQTVNWNANVVVDVDPLVDLACTALGQVLGVSNRV